MSNSFSSFILPVTTCIHKEDVSLERYNLFDEPYIFTEFLLFKETRGDPGKNKSSVPVARRTRRLKEEDIWWSFGSDSKNQDPASR